MSRTLTHFFPVPPEPGMWIPLPFITRDERGAYFLGFEIDELIFQEVREREASREIHAVEGNLSIAETQCVWVTPERAVFIASANDPTNDPARMEVYKSPKAMLEELRNMPFHN